MLVKGGNFLIALVVVQGMGLPSAVDFVWRTVGLQIKKTGKVKRKSSKTKNDMFREMITHCDTNFIFDFLVCDSWYSNVENMEHLKGKLGRNFALGLKSKREVALCPNIKEKKEYVSIETLRPGQQTVEGLLEGLNYPLLCVKQVFKTRMVQWMRYAWFAAI